MHPEASRCSCPPKPSSRPDWSNLNLCWEKGTSWPSLSLPNSLVLLSFPYVRIHREWPEENFQLWVCASPLLLASLVSAAGWQIDPTYKEITAEKGKEFYLINISAFSDVTLKWFTGARIRLNGKSKAEYKRAFSTLQRIIFDDHPHFSWDSVEAILVDFERAQMSGIAEAWGNNAKQKIKGCKVHFSRSLKKIRDRVCESSLEKELFWLLGSKIRRVRTRQEFRDLSGLAR